jgi:hypothetical protein
VLRGLGVTLTLPWLEAMTGRAAAQPPGASGAVGGAVGGTAAPPVRMACVFMPNGVNYAAWEPTGEGTDYTLSSTLEPLAPVREHLNILTGLTLAKARANGDGPGDHARSSASFLTGHQARKTAGNDIRIGVSVDQVAAREIGAATRLPSLEIGCEHSPTAGNCDSGYSCAYTANISWRSEDAPCPKIVDPAAVFERLFGDSTKAAAAQERLIRRRSILDFVREDARRLEARLGQNDRRKLDQFQTAVREIEDRIGRAAQEAAAVKPSHVQAPTGIPRGAGDHIDLMYDMLLLAFQTDSTRISTFMLGVDGSNRSYPEIGVKDGHHHLSHHQNNQEMIEKIRLIDRFYAERFARFVDRLAKTPEGEGTLLDSCMILHGGGISDGNRHNHENLPILLAGRAGGTIETGRLVRYPKETPLCNLYTTMLERMGCGSAPFGDGTESLRGLTTA